jgi:hypothetical protein
MGNGVWVGLGLDLWREGWEMEFGFWSFWFWDVGCWSLGFFERGFVNR